MSARRFVEFAIFMLALTGCSTSASLVDALPESLGRPRVVAHAHSIGGVLEGCRFTVYQLDTAVTVRLDDPEFGFLRYAPRARDGTDFSKWVETPFRADGAHPFALGALNRRPCAMNGRPQADEQIGDTAAWSIAVDNALAAPGSVYATTFNREGMIIVDKAHRFVAFLYFG